MATSTSTPVPAKIVNGKKTFTVLENNPAILTSLAHTIGLSPSLTFTDIYSLSPLYPTIPRPALALIAILPFTEAWNADRLAENERLSSQQSQEGEAEIHWFKQTIGNACGSYALIHSLLNGPASSHLIPNSIISNILSASITSKNQNENVQERAKILYDSEELEQAHQEAAQRGDSQAPPVDDAGKHVGLHFVAFVKSGGRLWELEGSRNSPLDRGSLADDEDVLSETAIAAGIGRVIDLERASGGGDLRFSVVALVEDSVDGGD